MGKELHIIGDKIMFQVVTDGGLTADVSVVEGIWSSGGKAGGTFRVKILLCGAPMEQMVGHFHLEEAL